MLFYGHVGYIEFVRLDKTYLGRQDNKAITFPKTAMKINHFLKWCVAADIRIHDKEKI